MRYALFTEYHCICQKFMVTQSLRRYLEIGAMEKPLVKRKPCRIMRVLIRDIM